jgi:PAS domain S-box-containing protein
MIDSAQSFLDSEGEMAQHIARFPWSDHPLGPLGPLEAWSPSLKTAVSIILNSQHPMWIGWGDQMSFLYNDAYVQVLGRAKHPWALGRPADEVWAEIWDVCGPLADKVFQRGEATFLDDVRLMMNRGTFLEETFFSFSYSPIRDEFGRVAGLFCPSNDVTAKVVGARRSRALSELVANALVQKSTAAACASAIATLAHSTDDAPFALLYLYDGEDCRLEQAAGMASDERTLAPFAPSVARVAREGRSHVLSLRELAADVPPGPDGTPILEAVVLPLTAGSQARALGALVVGVNPGRPLDAEYRAFFELVASNISAAVQNARATEEERRRIEALAEMDRAKTAFFSNVSHEFRTPLTLMLGPLGELAKMDDERDRSLAETARRNALRLLKLVNTLLEFSRLEAGRNDATFAATRLDVLTRDIASSFRSAIETAGLRFTVETQLEDLVYVDGSMWERILLNLLSNALKFTFEGGITVRLQREGEHAVLSVTDTGGGIAADELPQLFERFHRVRGAQSRTHEGSGIGLALVRDLADVHGGSVSVESTVGTGTTFTVRLPLGSAHLDASRVVTEETAAYSSAVEQYLADVDATVMRTGPTGTLAAASDGLRTRVLLADDNADLREYVGGMLSGRYDVTAVKNGREALALAQTGAFDLIVSDVMMPEMDGFELLHAVRADARIAATPFMMLSARAGQEAALEGLREGADDYIVKPFAADEFLARVHAQTNAAAIRERATHDLRASEERFRTLAGSLPHIVFESDADGAVIFLSDEYSDYTGLPADSGYGDGWMRLIHPDDVALTKAKFAGAIAAGDVFFDQFRLRHHGGVYRWFHARALPQHAANGSISRWIGTITDVHEQRKAARER